jgi:histidine triad (HIT) family protein
MDDCIFCKIVAGKVPCNKVHEDTDTLAFLDISPAAKGHTLVIPKAHYEILTDIPPAVMQSLSLSLQKVARQVHNGLEAEGFNLFINNKPAAGQVVPHAHFHIVPRKHDDGIKMQWPQKSYEIGEMEEIKEKVSGATGNDRGSGSSS